MNIQDEMREHIDRIMMLPDLINEKSKQSDQKEEIAGMQAQRKEILATLEYEASLELFEPEKEGERGKNKYTNKDQRAKRAAELAVKDDLYIQAGKRLNELVSMKTMLAAEISQFNNEFSARKAALKALRSMLDRESAITNFNSAQLNSQTKTVEVKHV